MSDKLLGVLFMIKNEENSIKKSIESVSKYIKNIIVFDTGSTDNTINIIKSLCKDKDLILHLKEGKFISFPESRNEAIEFAEKISVKFLLLMDAGDEFRCDKNKKSLLYIIEKIPKNINFGIVKQIWLERSNQTSEHNDIRFIRNKSNCRYDLSYPVHEKFLNVNNNLNLSNLFNLYQDRVKHGGSSISRYDSDIEKLLTAKISKRNYYFLAQSYMCKQDFENGFKYNLLSYETNDDTSSNIDEKFTLVRIGFCAMMCKKSVDIIYKYLEMAISSPNPPIDAFVYMFKTSIDNTCFERAVPYIKRAFYLEKPNELESTLVNHEFYDYSRWNLISIICLFLKNKLPELLDIGKNACTKAVNARNNPIDLHNMKLYMS